MLLLPKPNLPQWLPQVNPRIWILAFGRLLSHIGTGFTLFYAPIFFVNQVGLSATAVGIAVGSAQVSGIMARFLGGSFSDSRFWGRRGTLLLSAAVSAIASFVMAAANDFPSVVIGNLLMGVGVGLYWPATEAVVADLTEASDRNEAYALTRIGDNIGLQLGIILGGIFINATGAYRQLFVIDGISFLVFFGVIYLAIAETYQPPTVDEENSPRKMEREDERENGWLVAFRDRVLWILVAVNIMFTLYVSQIQTILPLYLTNFVPGDFSPATISGLFTWHITLSVVFQLPVAKFLNRFARPRALIFSAFLWGVGFILTGIAGTATSGNLLLAILALSVFAIAFVSYSPVAASFFVSLAPESLRGIYLSINSQCWAIGYLIGPPLAGLALDSSATVVNNFWLAMALSVVVAIWILQNLDKTIKISNY